jgi:hypothetical protein
MKAAVFLLLVSAALSACHPRPGLPGIDEPLPELFSEEIAGSLRMEYPAAASPACILQVERTGCGGPCPEWDARFYSNGVATLIRWNDGAFSAGFDPDSLQWAFEAAQAAGFSQFPDTVGFLLQLPAWKITMENHSILHNHDGPQALLRLERQLEEWILARPWKRIDH